MGWGGTKETIGGNESGMAIRSNGMDPKERERGGGREGARAHLLILQAPQAEDCSRVVFGWTSDFWARREVEEEEPSEGEPEWMGIIVKKGEREKRKKENGRI